MTHPFLQKLLAGQAVEWKPLGEVCEIKKGKQLNKTELKECGLYPAYNGGKTYSGWADCYNVEADTIIISQGGASAGFVNFITVPFWANAHCYYLLPNLEFAHNRYLYHFLKYNESYFMENQHGAGIPALSQAKLSGLSVPIPPLSVQTKIAEILDKFTAITAELNIRNQQYQYYRDKLLSADELAKVGFEWKTLGEVSNIVDGTHQTPKYTDTGVPFVSVENIKDLNGTKKYISQEDFEKYKLKPVAGDVLMTRIGVIGACTVVENNKPLAYYVTLALIRINIDYLLPKYIKYYLESGLGRVELYKKTLINAVPIKINLGDIKKIPIPIPPLSEQARIVAILDKFDTLTQSITEGLPREIELRQKQYEYYREMLLGFGNE